MCVNRLQALVLFGLAVSGLQLAGGMRVYTSGEQEAVNGTDVRLKCTFESKENINPNVLSVSWTFRPLGPGHDESVFFYQNMAYPPQEGRFRKKALWAGDIMGGDASIIIHEVKFSFNGTFSCVVKNPPDVHGNPGTVKLTVVYSASFSEIVVVAGIILGAIALIMVLLVLLLSIRRCHRKRQQREQASELPHRERKDPTMCHLSKAEHLYEEVESFDVDSSDCMISDPSNKDSSSSEEDERSSDEGGDTDSDRGPPADPEETRAKMVHQPSLDNTM